MLSICILPQAREAALIRSVRQQTMEAIGAIPDTRLCEPISVATYIALKKDDKVIGLIESFLIHRVYKTLKDCPYYQTYTPEMQENYNSIGHVRTIFMLPEYRKLSFGYIYLYLAANYYFAAQGARYGTAMTSTEDARFTQLYEHTGGTKLGDVMLPNIPKAWSLFVFPVETILKHRLMPRMHPLLAKNDFAYLPDIRID